MALTLYLLATYQLNDETNQSSRLDDVMQIQSIDADTSCMQVLAIADITSILKLVVYTTQHVQSRLRLSSS